MGVRLTAETSAARLVGRLSRAAGRGGGTTLPGKLLWKVDPGALDALAARLPAGVAVVSATNGKTTTSAMLARILGSRYRLAWNNSGANLASGVASTLLSAPDADLGLLEVDEFALPEVMRRVQSARRRRSATSSAISSTATASSSTSPSAGVPPSRRSPPTSTLVVNADDPLVADLADGREPVRCDSASTIRGWRGRRCSTPPIRSTAFAAARPYDYAAAYVGHLGDYRCPACGHARPPLDVAARSIDLQALDASVFDLVTPAGTARVRLPLPGLYNVYNALAAAAAALALDASLDEIVAGLGTFTAAFGRFERIEAGDKRILMLLIKNPAGANEAIRTLEEGGVPDDARDRPQRPDRRRPRRLVDLGRRLRAAARAGRQASWRAASGRRSSRLRFTYAGFPRDRLEVIPDLREALDRGLALVPAGRRARRPPHLHGDARAAADRRRPRPRAAVLGGDVVRIRGRPPLPGLPQHLRRPRQHRRARAPCRALRGHALEVTGVEPGDSLEPCGLRPDLRRRRPGSRAGADRAGSRGTRRDDLRRAVDTRHGAPRRLWRLPAARTRLSRARRLVDAGRRPLPATRRSPARSG